MSITTHKRKKTDQIFKDFACLETNPWWKKLFLEISEGFFPHHLSYSNFTVYFKGKGAKHKTFSLVNDSTKEELLELFKQFLRKTVQLMPDDELDVLNGILDTDFVLTWNVLNRNTLVRDIFIWKYLTDNGYTGDKKLEKFKEIWWGFIKDIWNEEVFEIKNNRIVAFNPDVQVKKTPVIKKLS